MSPYLRRAIEGALLQLISAKIYSVHLLKKTKEWIVPRIEIYEFFNFHKTRLLQQLHGLLESNTNFFHKHTLIGLSYFPFNQPLILWCCPPLCYTNVCHVCDYWFQPYFSSPPEFCLHVTTILGFAYSTMYPVSIISVSLDFFVSYDFFVFCSFRNSLLNTFLPHTTNFVLFLFINVSHSCNTTDVFF